MNDTTARATLLTLNAGSSSLKVGIFLAGDGPSRLASASVDRIGRSGSKLSLTTAEGERHEQVDAATHVAALDLAIHALVDSKSIGEPAAVAHRIVHGGPRLDVPLVIDDEILRELRAIAPLDPEHLPAEIALVEASRHRWPELPHVACFDTSFHRSMPRVARMLPLPRRLEQQGIRRYGFHGLSYSYLMAELSRMAPAEAAGRVVLAHLGSGSSMAAVQGGAPIDTTMAFTPTAGMMMGTRSGDLDPGVILHLLRDGQLDVPSLDRLLNHESGLLGVSGQSADIRDLLAAEAGGDTAAGEAVSLYCHIAGKHVGALAASLDGLDALVFSGGIGENSPPVRARIAERLGHLGAILDPARNEAGSVVISRAGSRCTVRVIPTDEEATLARETIRLLHSTTPAARG
jgi:acetate kinase